MPAIPAAIGIGGSLIQGFLGSHGAKSAAKTQAAASEAVAGSIDKATGEAIKAGYAGMTEANGALTDNTTKANGVLSDVYQNLSGTLDPYLAAGKQGLTSLTTALAPGGNLSKQFSFNPSDLENDPGYQFQLKEGMKALANSAAARGTLGAGGTSKAMENYSQGLAGTTFNQAYGRAANTFQMNRTNTLTGLQLLTGIGQDATSKAINVGQNYGNNTSANDMMLGRGLSDVAMNGNQFVAKVGLQGAEDAGKVRLGGADATAAGQMGSTNAWSNTVNGVSGGLTTLYKSLKTGGADYGSPGAVPTGVYSDLPTQRGPAAKQIPLIPPYQVPKQWGVAA